MYVQVQHQNQIINKSGYDRGGWKYLESLIRSWVIPEREIHIITGGIFQNKLGRIGTNDVTIPSHYYKAVYCNNKMIGFVLPNEKIKLQQSRVSVALSTIKVHAERNKWCKN